MENKKILTEELGKILPIFINEFREYINPEKLRYLENEEKISNIIQYTDKGMGAFHSNGHIFFSNVNKKMFEKLKLHSQYGINPDKKLVEPDQFINNKKDYMDYINYCVEKGATELDYALDVLPHEIMHLIGSSGGVIGEGVTELRTRQICQKYKIRCAPVLHAKETELAMQLDKLLGKHVLNRNAFGIDENELEVEFDKIAGNANYRNAYSQMAIEYNRYLENKLQDPIAHYREYRNIDYSPMLNLIKDIQKQEIR